MKHTMFLVSAAMSFCLSCSSNLTPPAPYGAVPTVAQLEWQKMEYYMFVHFGPNTFTDVEWGDGRESPTVFNPTNLDCRQWVQTAQQAGMKGIIITAKHHDGFCLWPSAYSTHTVRESLWKDGKGDVLRELAAACRQGGLKFGVYLSPWDRNHPTYGTPEYNQVFVGMLNEVLSGYGDIFEQWFDGANGEGENGKKQVYDWPLFNQTVYNHQPQAVIFSDVGPDCRWIGNEAGSAGESNWSRLHIKGFGPGHAAPPSDTLNAGNVFGKAWVPGEADVSIRPGWFYSAATDDKVKSVQELMDIYYTSVGRNSNLLLNVPPNRVGRIHPADSARLVEFRAARESLFANNLVKAATVTASAVRANAPQYAAANVQDDDFDTYWTVNNATTQASIEVQFAEGQTFNRLLLQEYIPLGQRVAKFNVEVWDNTAAAWKLLTEATTIGYKRILRFPAITAERIRINILHSLACPVLSTVSAYKTTE